MITTATDTAAFQSGYSDVNGLRMYYEIHGEGAPLVLIHGGGSTIETTFGRVLPPLARSRRVIAVELQAHGRTSDRPQDLSFEQDADDVATLLKNLHISRADIFGFSNGGTTAIQIAIRHPEIVSKLVLGSALVSRDGVPPPLWDFMNGASLDNMPGQLKEAYLEVAADPAGLQVMHDRDVNRMVHFKDIPGSQLQAIKAPALVINGDQDVITPEHALRLHRLMTNSRLAIIPGGHGEYIGEITTVKPGRGEAIYSLPVILDFLETKD